MCFIQKLFKQLGHRHPSGLGVQVGDELAGKFSLLMVFIRQFLDFRQVVQSQPERTSLLTVSPTQLIERAIAQADDRGAQEPGQGQIISGVGDGSQGVEDITYFGPVVKAPPGHGNKGNAGLLQRIFINAKSGAGPKEQRNILPLHLAGLL